MTRKFFQKLTFATAGATALTLGTVINSLPASAASFSFHYFGGYDWGTGSLSFDDLSLSGIGEESKKLADLKNATFSPSAFYISPTVALNPTLFTGPYGVMEPVFYFNNGNLVGITSLSGTRPPDYNWTATRAEWWSHGSSWGIGCAGRWSAIEVCNLIASKNMSGFPHMSGLIEFQTVTAWQGNLSQPTEPQPPEPQPPEPQPTEPQLPQQPKSVPEPRAMGGLALVALGFLAKKIVSRRRDKSSQVS